MKIQPAKNNDLSNLQQLYTESKHEGDRTKTAVTTYEPTSREKERLMGLDKGVKVTGVKVYGDKDKKKKVDEQSPVDPGMPGTGQPGTLPPDAENSPLGQYAAILAQAQSGAIDEPTALAQLQALGQDATDLAGQPPVDQTAAAPLEEEEKDGSDGKYDDRDGKAEKCDYVPCKDNETVDEEIDPSVALGGPSGHLSRNISLPSFGS